MDHSFFFFFLSFVYIALNTTLQMYIPLPFFLHVKQQQKKQIQMYTTLYIDINKTF